MRKFPNHARWILYICLYESSSLHLQQLLRHPRLLAQLSGRQGCGLSAASGKLCNVASKRWQAGG